MIRRLQKKFVLIAMLSSFAVVFSIALTINCIYAYQTVRQTHETLQMLAEHNGHFPKSRDELIKDFFFGMEQSVDEERPFRTRYFYVQTDSAGNVQYISLDNIATVKTEEALNMTYKALTRGKTYGTTGYYRYILCNTYYGKILVFMDCREHIETTKVLLLGSGFMMGLILAVLFVLISFFSRQATKPVAESYEKQKQFITDAGHELKTPLAVIRANAEVLELCGEPNEWLDSIKNQTDRLDTLVKNLVQLSRMDEEKPQIEFQTFALSDAVQETAAAFQTPAQNRGIRFETHIQPALSYYGSETDIRQLVSILCDNAVKYANQDGFICVSLYKKNRDMILEIYNTCEYIERIKLDRLFDRFYRVDTSRSRQSGGFGIGLSIAQAIVQAHKGKISAATDDEKSVRFTVII